MTRTKSGCLAVMMKMLDPPAGCFAALLVNLCFDGSKSRVSSDCGYACVRRCQNLADNCSVRHLEAYVLACASWCQSNLLDACMAACPISVCAVIVWVEHMFTCSSRKGRKLKSCAVRVGLYIVAHAWLYDLCMSYV
jgi:hypothetical protein